MDRKRFTVIRGGRGLAPAVEQALDLDCVPTDRWRRTIELRHGDTVVGTLRWEGMRGYRAVAETPAGVWRMGRRSVLAPGIDIRVGDAEIGTYEDGELRLRGHRFRRVHGRWVDSSGQVLMRDRGERLRIEPAGVSFPDHLLLALLGEYLKQVEGEPPEER